MRGTPVTIGRMRGILCVCVYVRVRLVSRHLQTEAETLKLANL